MSICIGMIDSTIVDTVPMVYSKPLRHGVMPERSLAIDRDQRFGERRSR